jgi:hypothetical protein
MDVILIVILIVLAVIIGWYDRYGVQRDYADLYAERHGHIPPLVDWFFKADADPEVEGLRTLHRNLYLLEGGLAFVAVIVLLTIRTSTPG